MAKFDAVVAEDRQSATITTVAPDGRMGTFAVNADEVGQIIRLLGVTRAAIVGGTTSDTAEGALCTFNPPASARIPFSAVLANGALAKAAAFSGVSLGVIIVADVAAQCVAFEAFIGWPDALTVEPLPRHLLPR